MAKEFDIYLNKRLTECDIIVYSIPFRDGLTATNRMIWRVALRAIPSRSSSLLKLAPSWSLISTR